MIKIIMKYFVKKKIINIRCYHFFFFEISMQANKHITLNLDKYIQSVLYLYQLSG